MSHVRNLFHNGPGHPSSPSPSPAFVATAPEFAGKPFVSKEFAPSLAAVPPIALQRPVPEFSVEEARILPEHRLVCYTDPHSPAADRFRYLRMRLREAWSAGKLKRILITSSLPHEGKSTARLNWRPRYLRGADARFCW